MVRNGARNSLFINRLNNLIQKILVIPYTKAHALRKLNDTKVFPPGTEYTDFL